MKLSKHDQDVLAELIEQTRTIAALPEQEQRRQRWLASNTLDRSQRTSPPPVLVLVHNFGGDYEGGYLPQPTLACENPEARELEENLRFTIFRYEFIPDDVPVAMPELAVGPVVHGHDDWGLKWKTSDRPGKGGAWEFVPVVHERADIARIHPPTLTLDEKATAENLARKRKLFGDLLPVRPGKWWGPSVHLIGNWCLYRGLENVMMDMIEEPAFVHEGMAMMAACTRAIMTQAEDLGILPPPSPGTHSVGDLPAPGYDPDHVRLKDLHVFMESQEFTSVSPAMHKEFALAHEKPLAELCGLISYGCCEDLTNKIEEVAEMIPNLRQIGVTPWANVAKCAERIGERFVVSWRPNPAVLAGAFPEEEIRRTIRDGLEVLKANHCATQICLKDIHSCGGKPERLTRWAEIVNEEIAELWA